MGKSQGRCGWVWKFSPPTGIRFPDRPALRYTDDAIPDRPALRYTDDAIPDLQCYFARHKFHIRWPET